ncbi:amp dependent CoA ligase [Flagelloscypha sp. PMI_526]|nr:amp dependent CoA ligase [Flagelloscypha sp. PMI_526]
MEFHSPSPLVSSISDNLTIPQFLLDNVHTNPSRPARLEHVPWLVEDQTGREIGLYELKQRTNDLAIAFSHKWQLVCLFSPNHVDYPVAIWATHRTGGIITPANPAFAVNELVYQLTASNAKAIVAHPAYFQIPSDVACHTVDEFIAYGRQTGEIFQDRKLRSGEAKTKLAFLGFSSGTTVIANVIQKVDHLHANDPQKRRYGPGDVAIGGSFLLHYLLFCGLTVVVVPKFDFGQFLKSIVKYKVNVLFVVPPQIVLICKHPLSKQYDIRHIKYVMSGAAPLSAEITQQLSEILPNAAIGQGFGMTESGPSVTMCPPSQKIGTLGSAGQLIAGVRARERGELVVNSPSIALGYWNNPQATKETFVGGWLRTGDEVIFKNGDMFVVDRIKEIIKLEGHLLSHPTISDACVVGIADDYSGEIPARILGAKDEAERLKAAIKKIAYKHLTGGVEFLDVIPKNPSGKLLRRILRDKAKADRANPKSKL